MTPHANEIADKIIKYANEEKDKLRNTITSLKNKITKKNSKNIEKKIQKLSAKIKAFDDAIKEIEILRKSSQIYDLKQMDSYETSDGRQVHGVTKYDLERNVVVMYVSDENDIGFDAHEFKHAYQFENHELFFSSETGNGLGTHIFIEREANRRARLFGTITTSRETGARHKPIIHNVFEVKHNSRKFNKIIRYNGHTYRNGKAIN